MIVIGTNVFYCIVEVHVYLRRKGEDLALSLVSDIRNCWQVAVIHAFVAW